MNFGVIDITVNGCPRQIDVDSMLEICDISTDMNHVAAQMAYWGSVLSFAEAERLKADTAYRNWRANRGKKIVDSNGKISEWKVKQSIEATSTFLSLKEALADAVRHATLCRVLVDAFRVKANMLQSKGAMLRAELDSTDMSTKEQPRRVKQTKNEHVERGKAAMRAVFRKKNKKWKNDLV